MDCIVNCGGKESDMTFTFCVIGYANTFDCVDQNKLWKTLKEKETDSDIRGKSFDERDCLLPEHATLSLPHSPPNLVNKYLSD